MESEVRWPTLVAALRQLKDLEGENRRLKQMYDDLGLEHQVWEVLLGEKSGVSQATRDGSRGSRGARVERAPGVPSGWHQ